MCGFVGIHRFDGGVVDPFLLGELAARLAHRGPDGHGHWCAGGVGLAHQRLAIIDPSGSQQPLDSDDGLAHVAFNGEILNYRELRPSLRYRFRTDGDTEVLLAIHRLLGVAGISRLRGQFAYAIHDEVDGTTWLVRDRLGVLPLYYTHDDRRLAFASEAKALVPLLPNGAEVDVDNLDAYLRRRSVPAPGTLLRGVRKLPPGHVARLDAAGRLTVGPWWSLPAVDTTEAMGDAEAVDAVARAVDEAVAENLVADVPVGAYLSGGLDSSLVSAVATRHVASPLRTFAVGFGDPRIDELGHARAVSDHLGTHHTEVVVGPHEFAGDWDRLTWHRDAPLSEPADIAVHRLAVAARPHVKVVLSGEGGDELFGGYPKHRLARLSAWSGAVPMGIRSAAATAADRIPQVPRRARIAAAALAAASEADRREAWFAPFSAPQRRALHGLPPAAADPGPAAGGDPLRRMLLDDAGPWLADNLLERGDRMTMAASVELRPPLLDHRLVDLAFRLPSRMKVRRATGKWVLREVARTMLPAAVVDRPKAGFRVPLDRWFRGDLRDLARDRLLAPSSFATSVFDRAAVAAVLDRHDRGGGTEDIRIFTLLALEVWHGACIAGQPGLVGAR